MSSYPRSLPFFSKSCTDHKLYSMAIGNNYGERRTRRANNYYHVHQRYEVIAHSLSCLLPTNGMPWELQWGPIRFEGHKQVAEFFFLRSSDGWPPDSQQANNGQALSAAHSVQKWATWGLSAALLCCGCHLLWLIRWGGFKLVNKLMKQHFDLKYCIRTSKYLLDSTYLLKPCEYGWMGSIH